MNLTKGVRKVWFEFSAEVTDRIKEAESGNLPIKFYNLKSGCYQGIHSCEGDMIVICNAMADYSDLIMELIKQSDYDEYTKTFYEIHAKRCKKISLKLQEQIGYDREAAIERCQAKRTCKEKNSDVGEDAMVMMVKRAREKKGENYGRENIRGDSDNGGPERSGKEPKKNERI